MSWVKLRLPRESELPYRALAGAGTQGRARGERARAHAEARAEGWRDVAEHIAAAGAAAVVADGASGVGAQPVTAGVAGRIDTLHGEAGQELHEFSPQRPTRLHCAGRANAALPWRPKKTKRWRELWREPPVVSRGKTTRYRGGIAKPPMA